MALFFNLETLEREAANDSQKFLALLEYHYRGSIPRHRNSKYKPSKKSLAGYSFILNPGPLFHLDTCDVNYIVQYIKLCALRDWTHYKFHNVKSLDTTYFPDLNVAKIQTNPLLELATKSIKFKYEESYNGNSFRINQG